MENIASIILAAGKGKRMVSNLPKVMHKIAGKPMIYFLIKCFKDSNINDISVVVGHKKEILIEYLKNFPHINISHQDEQLGTAHAVGTLKDYFKDKSTAVLIINGDTPLIKSDTIREIFKFHLEKSECITVVTSDIENPYGYGRILRNSSITETTNDYIDEIIEEKDADTHQKLIKEINVGIYIVNSSILFELISEISNDNKQGEYYLTDIVKKAKNKGIKSRAFKLSDNREGFGINSREELARAEEIMQEFIKKDWMSKGVQLILPGTIYIESDVILSKDVIIEPNCIIKGKSLIEEDCFIGGFSYIEDSHIPKGQIIRPFSKIINSNIDNYQ